MSAIGVAFAITPASSHKFATPDSLVQAACSLISHLIINMNLKLKQEMLTYMEWSMGHPAVFAKAVAIATEFALQLER